MREKWLFCFCLLFISSGVALKKFRLRTEHVLEMFDYVDAAGSEEDNNNEAKYKDIGCELICNVLAFCGIFLE
jgi:hypothetical protein